MPLRKLSINKRKRRMNKPWMSTGLMKSSARKSELFVISKCSKDPKYYEVNKHYLNIFTEMKKIACIYYFREKAILHSHDIAKTWRLVKGEPIEFYFFCISDF